MAQKYYTLFIILFYLSFKDSISIRLEIKNEAEYEKIVTGKKHLVFFFHSTEKCKECPKIMAEFLSAGKDFKKNDSIIFSSINSKSKDFKNVMKTISQKIPFIAYMHHTQKNEYFGQEPSATEISVWVNATYSKITEKMKKLKSKQKNENEAVELTPTNFKSLVIDSDQHVLLSAYKKNCGKECKLIDQLAKNFRSEDSLLIAKMNVSKKSYHQVLSHFNMKDNPTLLWFARHDKKQGKIFGGEITLLVLTEFLNDKAGCARSTTGDLKKNAGRIHVIDLLIEEHIEDLEASKRMKLINKKIKNAMKTHHIDRSQIETYMEIIEAVEKGKPLAKVLRGLSDSIYSARTKRNLSKMDDENLTIQMNVVNMFVDASAAHVEKKMKKESGEFVKKLDIDNVHYSSHDEL